MTDASRRSGDWHDPAFGTIGCLFCALASLVYAIMGGSIDPLARGPRFYDRTAGGAVNGPTSVPATVDDGNGPERS